MRRGSGGGHIVGDIYWESGTFFFRTTAARVTESGSDCAVLELAAGSDGELKL